LDDSGNRVLSGQDYGFANDSQAVKQGIQCNVRLFLAEYWLDQSLGVNWIGKILIRNASPAIVKSEIAAAISSTPDVTRVVNVAYSVDSQTRAGSIAYTVASTQGLIPGEFQT
jgi:hypothetical protein